MTVVMMILKTWVDFGKNVLMTGVRSKLFTLRWRHHFETSDWTAKVFMQFRKIHEVAN